MIALVNALHDHLDEETTSHLFLISDQEYDCDKLLGDKLHNMAQKLKLLHTPSLISLNPKVLSLYLMTELNLFIFFVQEPLLAQ